MSKSYIYVKLTDRGSTDERLWWDSLDKPSMEIAALIGLKKADKHIFSNTTLSNMGKAHFDLISAPPIRYSKENPNLTKVENIYIFKSKENIEDDK